MNQFKRKRARWPLIASLFIPALGVMGYLYFSGWFVDPKSALRELERLGVPPNVASVFTAAEKGDADLLRIFARANVPTSEKDASGNAPLHVAMAAKHWVAAKILTEHQSNLDAVNGRGQVPLELAFKSGGYEAADTMLSKGASTASLFDGVPALIALINAADHDGIEILLKHKADPDIANRRGETPLFLAVKNGNPELVASLLGAGADANGVTPAGQPMLNYFLNRGEKSGLTEQKILEMVRLLNSKGADLERADSEGLRPIHYSLASGLSTVTSELLPRVSNIDAALWVALDREDDEGARMLLEKGANPHELNENADTPLIGMIRKNRPEMIQH